MTEKEKTARVEILARMGGIVKMVASEATPDDVLVMALVKVRIALGDAGIFEALDICPHCAKDFEASRIEDSCGCICAEIDHCPMAHCAECGAHVRRDDAHNASRCPNWRAHDDAARAKLLEGGVAPWDEKTATVLSQTARRCMFAHQHGPLAGMTPEDRLLTAENCSACVLAEGAEMLLPRGEVPNYAGWARVYVQCCVRVPAALLERELARTDNPRYVEALRRDLATWPQPADARRRP